MITLSIIQKGGIEWKRVQLEKPEIQIGSADANDVVLPGISRRHARFVEKDQRLIIVDLKSDTGTYHNGRRITAPMIVRPTDKIYIGDFTLRGSTLLPEWPDDADVTPIVEAMELQLLDAIAQGDDHSRLVYADWLEQRGRPERAEWLRLVVAHEEADPERRIEIRDRLREGFMELELRWRLRVARPRIQLCVEELCPQRWEALEPTAQRHVRRCGACSRNIYYCGDAFDARAHHEFGDRVAVELHASPDEWHER